MSKKLNCENTAKRSKTTHGPDGKFASKKNATSVSYGHYEKPEGGKYRYTPKGVRMTKHKAGAKRTGPNGGEGKYKLRLKDGGKEPLWEIDVTQLDGERLGTHLEALLTDEERLVKQLASVRRGIKATQARVSVLEEEWIGEDGITIEEDALSSTDEYKRYLKIAGLTDEAINEHANKQKQTQTNSAQNTSPM